jgi:hypothetical protein
MEMLMRGVAVQSVPIPETADEVGWTVAFAAVEEAGAWETGLLRLEELN